MPGGMCEPPPLAATLPPRRALILLATIWAIAVFQVAGLVRGLVYFCFIPPERTLVDNIAAALLFAGAAAVAVALYGWVRPETRAGRLGATLLSAIGSAFPCLWVYAFLLSFEADQAAVLAGLGTVVLPLPSAIAIGALAELMGWLWTPGAR